MSNLPADGKYRAKCVARPFYPEPGESGAMMIHIPCELVNSEVPFSGVAKTVIVKTDGSLMKKSIQAIHLIFGGELSDLFFVDNLPDEEVIGKEFEVVGARRQWTPEDSETPIDTFELSWPAPVGGMGAQPIVAETRKQMLTKFGSKFKALFGSKPAATSAKPTTAKPAQKAEQADELPMGKSAPAAKKPAISGPPGRKSTAAQARTSTQEEVWSAFETATPDDSEDDRVQKWYDACDAVVDGSSADPTLLTPTNWGAVADKLEV